MPVARLVLTLVAVILAAAATVAGTALLAGRLELPAAGMAAAGLVALMASLGLRLAAGRRIDRGKARRDDPES